MKDQTQFKEIIFKSIDRVNDVLLAENAVPKESETILLGQGAVLDSMGFVNFVVALEELAAQEARLHINLMEALNANDSTASQAITVAGLADFLAAFARQKATGEG